jgi:uncharacterized protein (DUF433 family)
MASDLEKQQIEITPGVCDGKPRIAGTFRASAAAPIAA